MVGPDEQIEVTRKDQKDGRKGCSTCKSKCDRPLMRYPMVADGIRLKLGRTLVSRDKYMVCDGMDLACAVQSRVGSDLQVYMRIFAGFVSSSDFTAPLSEVVSEIPPRTSMFTPSLRPVFT